MLLYLHIPFCENKCFYCSFCSYVGKNSLFEPYMEAVSAQFKYEAVKLPLQKNSIKSLFVGGGTPSVVSPQMFKPFIEKIAPFLTKNAEITTEVNPNSASLAWLRDMKKLGFNRVSFGVQSFDEKKLKFLGRIHNSKEANEAVLNAKKAGFKNISIDLMYGTKVDTKKLLQSDIETAAKLPINHISAYSLTIEKNSKFYKQKNMQKDSLVLAKFVVEHLKNSCFSQYEISSFSRNYECCHNKGYWQGADYVGIGCGAVGFYKNKRFYTSENVEEYIKNPTFQKMEELTQDDVFLEKIFLSLRSNIGLEISNLSKNVQEKISILTSEKKGVVKNGKFYNSNFFLADEMALFLTHNT